jgi:outer membrane protein
MKQVQVMKNIWMVVVLLAVATGGAMAQKLGHVNSEEILLQLPERVTAKSTIESRAAEYETAMASMQQELQTKFADYQAKAESWPPAIRQQKERELQGLDEGLQEFASTVQSELVELEQELLQPMMERVQQAIDAVGAEKGYAYIFDLSSGAVVFKGGGDDVTPLVKAKLGI